MTPFIAIQNTYQTVELALFNNTTVIDKRHDDKRNASRILVPLLDDLLTAHNYALQDLSFIAINQGPGPFSTLRVVIATVNGLSFASNTPLIGIDGLEATLTEYADQTFPHTVVLLNAFNFDVYFAIQQPNKPHLTGYKKIDPFLQELHSQIQNKPVRFLGNATHMYTEKIRKQFGNYAIIPEPLPSMCTIEQIGLTGLEQWRQQKGLAKQLLPLYLKKHPVQKGP